MNGDAYLPLVLEEDDSPLPYAEATGQRLGRYRLCFEVARGGMATVYLAHAEGARGFGKLVALKRIHPHLANDRGFVDMFWDEARIASALTHPNVCGVTDFGAAGDTFFLTMEFLVGESLSRVQKKLAARQMYGCAALPELCKIVSDAAEGLHSAHELLSPSGAPMHVVHRDVSPHNVFVGYDGSVKVVDFGIASAAERLHHTKTGTVKGKLAYMAPEQLLGVPVDRRADVWALGVVLWELVAAQRLFKKRTESETMFAVLDMPIPPLASLVPEVPRELDRIVARALTRDRDARYATARELGRELAQLGSSLGQTVGMPELAELMGELFPSGHAEKQKLLKMAAELGDRAIPRVPELRPDSTESTVLMQPDLERAPPVGRPMKARGVLLGVAAFLVAFALALLPLALLKRSDRGLAPRSPLRATSAIVVARLPAREAAPTPAPPASAEPARITPPPADPARIEQAPPAEPARRGRVSVSTPGGWADVRLGGRLLGQTPGQFDVPAGRQVLSILPFGSGPARRVRVNVEPDSVARVRVDLADPQ